MGSNKIINFDSVERFSPDYKYGLNETELSSRRENGLINDDSYLGESKFIAVRNGQEIEISSSDIVLDDIIIVTAEETLSFDAVVLFGDLVVDESFVNGNGSQPFKRASDTIVSGTMIISGKAYVKVDKICTNSFVQKVKSEAKDIRKPSNFILKTTIIMAIAFAVAWGLTIALNISKINLGNVFVYFAFLFPFSFCLFTVIATVKVIRDLKNENINVKNAFDLANVSESSILCIDKTGIISSGDLKVSSIEMIDQNLKEDQAKQIISNILISVKDDNKYASALREYFDYDLTANASKIISFKDNNKYSGASFKAGKTYILGAPSFLNLENKQAILRKTNEFISKGLTVLALGKSDKEIDGNEFNESLTPVCLVMLREKVNSSFSNVVKDLKAQGISIKVISGDNAQLTSEMAKEVGIENAERYISLERVELSEVALMAQKYTVFGKASAEQKRTIIESLKKQGCIVGMYGDGADDILAMKAANYSVSTSNLDNTDLITNSKNTEGLNRLFSKARNYTSLLNVLWPIAIAKFIFTLLVAVITGVVGSFNKSFVFPLNIVQSIFIDIAIFGLLGVQMIFEGNTDNDYKHSLKRTLLKSLFSGLLLIVCFLSPLVLMYMDSQNIMYLNIANIEKAISIGMISVILLSFILIGKLSFPLNKDKAVTLGVTIIVTLLIVLYNYIMCVNGLSDFAFIGILFQDLTLLNYFVALVITAVASILYIGITHILNIIRRGKADANI